MKNALIFFYNINVSNDALKKINNNYYFKYQNNDFIVAEYNRNLNEINEIYNLTIEMLNYNFPLYKIIITQENKILFFFEQKYYVLMIMPKITNRVITFSDILDFNYVPINSKYKLVDKSMWSHFWEDKIDYLEYQFFQTQKRYPLIKKSINYYLGIWENAISYYNDNITVDTNLKGVCHKRITTKMDLLSFLNPLNLVVDYKERDIADYIKSYIYEEKWTKEQINIFLAKIPLEKNIVIRIVSRILFPSDYFDLYENIIYDNWDEQELLKVINNNKNYETLINLIFQYYKKYNIPLIDWAIKKD